MDTDEPCSKSEGFYQALTQTNEVGQYISDNPGLLTRMSTEELADMMKKGAKRENEGDVIRHTLNISEAMLKTIDSWPSRLPLLDSGPLMELFQSYCNKKKETQNECRTFGLYVTPAEKRTNNCIPEAKLTQHMADEFTKALGQPIMHLNSEKQADLRTAIEKAGFSRRNIQSSIQTAEKYKDLAKYPLHLLYMNFLAKFIDHCERSDIKAKKGGGVLF